MVSSIKFYSNTVLLGELVIGDDTAKLAGTPGTYMDYYYADANGVGLPADTVYDPALHKQMLAIMNTVFTSDSFENLSRDITNKLILAETVEVSFCEDGVEVKRRTVTAATYWFFVTDGKFQEKLRVIIDQLV